ncbi:MAG: signal recognition particle-docking protein FtsY [Vigna little leaf phytoplasma]|nr:signal recognition particle-docking protein FtsY [Vigna little leaf phytoplasma]
MFDFFKKIFQKKNPPKDLGVDNIEFSLNQWILKIQKKNIIDISCLRELEILFIKMDMGLKTSKVLINQIQKNIDQYDIKKTILLISVIKETILFFYKKNNNSHSNDIQYNDQINKFPRINLFVGVNGVGKTTTIGKLAYKWNQYNKKVLLIAGDTFRTGAVEQLKVWGEKTKSKVFHVTEQLQMSTIPPSKLFFDALNYAKKEKFDIILCDTSGRLQNKINLMKEIEKIHKMIKKHFSDILSENFLILDSMTGQNGLQQTEIFNKFIPLNGVIFTKFDNISKAGLILAIRYLYNLETKYIGVGEKIQDLIDFNIEQYVDSLFS